MPRPDEGLIHAWLDGQLPPDEAARIEGLVATDPEWAAAVAEARGLVAASSRILSALDRVPAGVMPKGTTARTTRMPWWTRIAAAIVVVAGGSAVVMQYAPEGRLSVQSTAQGAARPTPDTQKVVAEAPATSPPAPATTNAVTTARVPAAASAGVPAGAVIGREDAPAPRREKMARQPITPPAAPASSAKTSIVVEQKAEVDEKRVVAELSAPQSPVAKAAQNAERSAAESVAQSAAQSAAQRVAQVAAPQAPQATTQDRARAQNSVPAPRGVGGAVAFRSAQGLSASLCYRLVPDSASGPASIMRAVRMTSDTLYVASLESNPLQRAWLVLRDGMKGVMTTSGDLRSTIRVVATPTACPTP